MVAKELDCGLMEGAFFRFEKELIFSQLLEDLLNMLAMFGRGLRVQDVDVNQHKAVKVFPEHLIYAALDYKGAIDQPIWHNIIFLVAYRHHKCGPPLTPLTYPGYRHFGPAL